MRKAKRLSAVSRICNLWGSMLSMDMPILQSLSFLEISLKKDFSRYSRAFGEIHKEFREGECLVASLRDYPRLFPTSTIALVDIGEETANLPTMLKKASNFAEMELYVGKVPKGKNKLKEILFYTGFSSLIGGGYPLLRSLNILYDIDIGFPPKKVLGSIRDSIQEGELYSEVMKKESKYFSRIAIETIKWGERNASLKESLEIIATYVEKDFRLRTRIRV